MLYKITRKLDKEWTTQVEDYPISDDVSWAEWIAKSGIQVHTHKGTIWDISPDDMLAQIPDAEAMKRQLALVGVTKRISQTGQPIYELDEEIDTGSVSGDDISLCEPELDTEQL